MIDALIAEVMTRRPRRYVDGELDCRAVCGQCWRCLEGGVGRFVVGTGRYVDLTHGTKRSTVITTDRPFPFREEELASPWLRACFARGLKRRGVARKRVPWSKGSLRHLELLPPRFFAGKATGLWAYVDLIQAYPTIYSRLALDMKWIPDPERPILGVGTMSLQCDDELLEAKAMHRAVGGILRSTSMHELVNGRPREVSTLGWSRYLAPDLWGVIQWTLHAIAATAVEEFGAVLWDTDGGVVPFSRAAGLIDALEDRWHMAARIEHAGDGTIFGVKHWKIGDDETAQSAPKRELKAEDRVLRPSERIVECLTAAVC